MSALRGISRFFRYWLWFENLHAAREGFEMIGFWITLLIGLAIPLGHWAGIHSGAIQSVFGVNSSVLIERLCLGYAGFIFFLWRPYRRHESQKEEHAKEKAALEKRIAALEDSLRPRFEIEGVRSEVPYDQKGECFIRIHNKSQKTITGVCVELTYFDRKQEYENHWFLHGILFPSPLDDSCDKADSITPGKHIDRALLCASVRGATSENPHINAVAVDAALVSSKNGRGHWGKFQKDSKYRLTIKVTGNDVPPMIQSFDLVFIKDGPVWYFTLEPVL